MKNNIPTAIIIAAIIVAIGLYLASLNDPLAKCMDKVIDSGRNPALAAKLCSGSN